MDLSIIIVNWNGSALLRNCLGSIFGSSAGIELEVIVVDNASHDDSVAMINREFPQVILLCNQQNLGFAAANNRGLAVARGRYVLFLNNDTLVLAGALAKSVRHMDANAHVGALGCRVEFPDRSFQTSCFRFNNLWVLFMTRLLPLAAIWHERLNIGRYWRREFTKPTEVDVVAGCFMVVRREVIGSVGGFDEDFFMYGEDEEWCSRIKRAGWQIIYFPGATIVHFHRFSSRHAHGALQVIECISPILVLHKRSGHLIAWIGNLILLLGLILRLPAWIVLGTVDLWKGTAQKGRFRSRFVALVAHLKGIVSPIWLPHTAKAAPVATHRTTWSGLR